MNKNLKSIIVKLSILLSLVMMILIMNTWKLIDSIYEINNKFNNLFYPEITFGSLTFVFLVFILFITLYTFLDLLVLSKFQKHRVIIFSLSIVLLLIFFLFLILFIIFSGSKKYNYIQLSNSITVLVLSSLLIFFIGYLIFDIKSKPILSIFNINTLNL